MYVAAKSTLKCNHSHIFPGSEFGDRGIVHDLGNLAIVLGLLDLLENL